MSRSFPSSRESSACPQNTVGGKLSGKNLQQRIHIGMYFKQRHAVLVVKAPCYKREGRGFETL
jgi:hypothetical protein